MKIWKVAKQSYMKDGTSLGYESEYFFTTKKKALEFVKEHAESYGLEIKNTMESNIYKFDDLYTLDGIKTTTFVTYPIDVK